MRAVGGNSASRIRSTCPLSNKRYISFHKLHCSSNTSQRPLGLPESTNPPVDETAASAPTQQLEHTPQAATSTVTCRQEDKVVRRRFRYLTFDEYVELQKQQQQTASFTANGSGPEHQTANEQPAASGADEEPKRRVPWNKGRKHSALTIARIIEGNNRARQRPEVRAKYDAWNQTRIGVALPEEHKANIRRRTEEGRLRKLQNSTPEELAARRAKLSERSKSLWQDPEYAKKTTAAIRTAKEMVKAQRQAAEGTENSSTVKPRQRRTRAADTADAEGEQQRPVRQPKAKKPSKKELIAAAEQQQQQLQQQLHRMLQTQQLIQNTEHTVQQLHANLAAFENNPQAYAMASQTMQRAQAHLQQARAQVQQLAQSLDEAGVCYDASTGHITHIARGPAAELLQKAPGGKQVKPRKSSPSNSSSVIGANSSNGGGLVRSKRSKPPEAGKPGASSSNGQALPVLPGDIVPSRRRGQLASGAENGIQGARQDYSSQRSPAAAAAEAAVSGGSSKSNGSSAGWSMVESQVNGNRSNGALNGHIAHPQNGSNGYAVEGDSSRFVTVQLQKAEEGDNI